MSHPGLGLRKDFFPGYHKRSSVSAPSTPFCPDFPTLTHSQHLPMQPLTHEVQQPPCAYHSPDPSHVCVIFHLFTGRKAGGVGFTAPCCLVRKLFQLEKSSKITRSNHQPLPTVPTKPRPGVPWLRGSNTPRDGDFTNSLDSLFQCLNTLWGKKMFLTSKLDLTWCNLRLLPLLLLFVLW